MPPRSTHPPVFAPPPELIPTSSSTDSKGDNTVKELTPPPGKSEVQEEIETGPTVVTEPESPEVLVTEEIAPVAVAVKEGLVEEEQHVEASLTFPEEEEGRERGWNLGYMCPITKKQKLGRGFKVSIYFMGLEIGVKVSVNVRLGGFCFTFCSH